MTTPSAVNRARFFTEAIRNGALWTVRDADGIPAPTNADDERAMPFWSLRSRAERVRDNSPEYQSFEVISIPLDDFRTNWLPGLSSDGLKVGVNWAGAHATGYDLAPEEVETRLDMSVPPAGTRESRRWREPAEPMSETRPAPASSKPRLSSR